MSTRTRTFDWSTFMSSMTPLKSAKGPWTTRMVSPTSQAGLNVGFAFFPSSFSTPRMRSTSRRDSGVGLVWDPTNPVTLGVLRTAYHASSSRYRRMSTYPGNFLRWTVTFLPTLYSTTSSIGMTTSKILSSRCIDLTRDSRFALTFFSYPEYEWICLLYTSDAADDRTRVDLNGRRG